MCEIGNGGIIANDFRIELGSQPFFQFDNEISGGCRIDPHFRESIVGADVRGTNATLLNQLGQAVLSKNLPNGSNQLDISSIDPGVYMLMLVNSTNTEKIKVVIDK